MKSITPMFYTGILFMSLQCSLLAHDASTSPVNIHSWNMPTSLAALSSPPPPISLGSCHQFCE